jgi:glycerophosphoryl diester phosphodiesterase
MKKILAIIITLNISLMSCEKEYTVDNLNDQIIILGHGGMGYGVAQYPMNSYEGFQRAIAEGADGVEIDIQLTKDSVLVCFHDLLLEHSTNKYGAIHTHNWADIKDGVYKHTPYAVHKVISLEQLFEYSNNPQALYTFDIKFNNPDNSDESKAIFQRALINIIEKNQLEDRITIESGDSDFLISLRDKKPGLNLFVYQEYDMAIQTAINFNFSGIVVRGDEITAEEIQEAHNHNVLVSVFGAKRHNQDEIIRKNVDIIQTDDVFDLVYRIR